MRRLLILLVCSLFFLLQLSGCQSHSRDESGVAPAPSRGGIEVFIEGGGEFPEFLVGRWKADRGGWEFVFEPGGTISSAVIEFGKTSMIPGQVTRYLTRYGGKGIFEPGKWNVYYEPEHRDLIVEVEVKHFYQDLGKDAVEGSIYYFLSGSVSDDWTQWTVDWYGAYKITVFTPEPTVLENMEEPEYKGKLVFEKVTDRDNK